MALKFYVCKHCGNLAVMAKDSGVRPSCCGEAMQELVANTTDAAQEKHVPVIAKNGDAVEITARTMKLVPGMAPAGEIFVDGSGVGDVGAVVLRDRKHLAEDGMVVVVLPISAHDGYMLAEPEIITRGFIYVKESEELMNELKTVVMSAAEGVLGRRSRDIGELKGAIKSGVSNYLFKTTKRSPMVIPVITKL